MQLLDYYKQFNFFVLLRSLQDKTAVKCFPRQVNRDA